MACLHIAKVAISAAAFSIDRPYDYRIPEELTAKILPGVRVMIPFGRGNHRREGIVLDVREEETADKPLKAIDRALDDEPVLDAGLLKLALWMRNRYFCTVYDAVHAMLPSGLWFKENGRRAVRDKTVKIISLAITGEDALAIAEQKRLRSPRQAEVLSLLASTGPVPADKVCYFTGATSAVIKNLEKQNLVQAELVEVFRRPEISPAEVPDKIILNEEQASAFAGLKERLAAGQTGGALLFGVTGSGKTQVYIRLIQEVLKSGKGAIVLVPEIGLTPQLVGIFSAHFGENVALLHSSLGIGERYDEWKRIRSGQARVVVGTRSAVFAPVEKLGLIIIDEEQEHTYKSENSPRYSARDVAKARCAQAGAMLLLGSATPDVESMYSAQSGKYALFELKNRYNQHQLPDVVIVDMKEELRGGNGTFISRPLEAEIRKNIERGEQSILFINRRGASNLVVCGECGYTYTCDRCSVSMTYHSVGRRIMCHYCGASQPVPEVCPECGGKLKFMGVGTQRVEEELRALFPDTEIIRMDTDTVSPARTHEKLLRRFKEKNVPILLGTQMVTKGLDFENVTLVGVISADQLLYVNDIRANERAFSLITQVVGRAGRGGKRGRALIQTFTPENAVIGLAARQDYPAFYENEIRFREMLGCPPFADMVVTTVSGPAEDAVIKGCVKIKVSYEHYFADTPGIKVLGPAPAAVAKVNNRYRYRVTLVCRADKQIRETVAHVMREFAGDRENRNLNVYADVNPND